MGTYSLSYVAAIRTSPYKLETLFNPSAFPPHEELYKLYAIEYHIYDLISLYFSLHKVQCAKDWNRPGAQCRSQEM